MNPDVWICLPTYNERENLALMVDALGAQISEHALNARILVIDDGSPDGTGEIADQLAAQHAWVEVLHRTKKEGLGRAYLAGFRHALAGGAQMVMEMDCDFSHDPADVPRLIAAARGDGVDIVLGSRNIPGGGVRNWPLLRRMISKGGSLYARTILGLKVRDLTGGFKCIHRRVLETLDLDSIDAQGYAFQVELTYRAVQAGFTVLEVPIMFVDRERGASKMSSSIMVEAMWQVWAMRFRRAAPPAATAKKPD